VERRAELPLPRKLYDKLTAGAGGITSVAGIAKLSGQGHPVGRLGPMPKTRGVHMTAPVRPRPYRRPRRAGAFRGPILLQPRSSDRGEASVLGTARSCDPGSSHPPADHSGIFRLPDGACFCPAQTRPEPGINNLYREPSIRGKPFCGSGTARDVGTALPISSEALFLYRAGAVTAMPNRTITPPYAANARHAGLGDLGRTRARPPSANPGRSRT
jgi:hypothetical protein